MRILILIVACILVYLVLRRLFQHNPNKFSRYFFYTCVTLFIFAVLFLVASGRLAWIFALLAVLAPWLRRFLVLLNLAPLLKSIPGMKNMSGGPSGKGRSKVSCHFLIMSLDHDSGQILGEVIAGEFKGRQLQDLSLEKLQRLLAECQSDADSYALLGSYLAGRYGANWQAQFDTGPASSDESEFSESKQMTRDEALDILGLSEPVNKTDIVRAHRSMMQKFHPDRGGSNYLAAKINEAKEILLAKSGNAGEQG